MKRMITLMATVVSLLALCGCFGNTPPVVKLGLIAPFEELHRDDGYAVLRAVQLAVEQRNAADGVAGYRIALVALNDNARPEETRQQAANLAVDTDVLGVIGPLHSAAAAAAAPLLAQHNLPWLTLASLDPEQLQAGFSLEASRGQLVAKAEQVLAAGGVSGPVVATDDPGLDPAGLGGVIWLGDAAGGAQVAQRLAPGVRLIGGPDLGSAVFHGRAGPAADGVWWLSAGPAGAELPDEFVAAYQRLAGAPPSPQAVLAYDASNLLLDAMQLAAERGAGLSRETVAEALQALGAAGWQGLSGSIVWQGDACAPPQACWPRLDPQLFAYQW